MKRYCTLLLIVFLYAVDVFATHNRAGEITYRHISGLTFEFTITTYTKESSIDADREELTIFWGDGTSNVLKRTLATSLGNNVKLNKYMGIHTYNGPFTYVVYMVDPNRVESVINMANSVNVPFYLEDTLKILDPTVFGFNNSPILLNPPIEFGNVNQIFVHNPNAYDPDGDSLSYRLVTPRQGVGMNVPGFVSPTQINPGFNNTMSINPITGELRWVTPQRQGIYNIAILITEYRNGRVIGTVVRDMQIIIEAANNRPPIVSGKDNICVVAGDTILETYTGTDPDANNIVILSSNGAPYEIDGNKAHFTVTQTGNPAQGDFFWATDLSLIRKNSYQMIVKAEDNAEVPLTDLKTVQIHISAPPVQNLAATYHPTENNTSLTWDENYTAKSLKEFQGFSVWRKVGCAGTIDSCNTNPAGMGYTKIGETTQDEFLDENMKRGQDYSYIVVAEFATKSQAGLVFNSFQSLAAQTCVELPLNIPFFYHVDVKETGSQNGSIYTEWAKPKAEDLDTIINPGPYTVELYRIDGTTRILLKTDTYPYFNSVWDTTFTDININTETQSHEYILEFYVAGDDLLGESREASSIFLNIIPSNETLRLKWVENVPWQNDYYNIYQKDENEQFVKIDSTVESFYLIQNLSNDSTYCFKVEGIGSYHKEGLKEPLPNFSQIVCAEPTDTTLLCTPILSINNFCLDESLNKTDFTNYLSWNFGRNCEDSLASKFYIFYKGEFDEDYYIVDSVFGYQTRTYEHHLDHSLYACYQVMALDEDRKSLASNEACVSDCPIYELPNTFTPNGDGINDLYTPIIPYSGVTRIDLKIYNRMGNLVYETTSPDINWKGVDSKGKELESGIFYYVCEVYYQTMSGEKKLEKPLSGYIQLLRGK
ncbi:MAG: gliding motility-associated C-terminal domain-containing protein [Chitinophagales bacterium]|nr:gliding motility-associated C-terminal domain-containing protein [Chitinophagales bacterium]